MSMLTSSRRVGRVGRTVLDEGTYRTPDGRVKVCAVVGRPDAVTVLPVQVTSEGVRFVLLVRQARPAVNELGLWEAVAGKIDYGESPADAAVRELREETGWEADHLHLLAADLYVSPGYSTERMTIFAATVTDTITARRPEDAAITADWVPLDEAFHATHDMKTVVALHLALNIPGVWRNQREGQDR